MNIDAVDAALERLARAPGPTELDRLERTVLARVSADRPLQHRDSFGLSAVAALCALVLGVAGGVAPDQADARNRPLLPLAGASELAPSSLLAGHR